MLTLTQLPIADLGDIVKNLLPIIFVVLYGVAANVCYSFGFMFELLLDRLWGDEISPVGPTIFRHGLVFSVGLTLLPIGLAWVGYLVTLVRWLTST